MKFNNIKKLIIILSISIISIKITNASSALYMSKITGEHYLVRNQANGDEAQPKALKHCEDSQGIGNCELVFKTDYGGYGAIAVGNKSQGYAEGKGNQAKADRLSLQGCKIKSTPTSCHITSRWHDEGKKIPRYKYIWVPDENNDSNYNDNGVRIDCGLSAKGLAKDCNTGRDYLGGY